MTPSKKYPASKLPSAHFEMHDIVTDLPNLSDIEAAIRGQSILERIIRRKFETMFIDLRREELNWYFCNGGPLETYRAKVSLLFALGKITPSVKDDLVLIGKIRNEFGHSVEPISFEHNDIKTKCDNFFVHKNLSDETKKMLGSRDLTDEEKSHVQPDIEFAITDKSGRATAVFRKLKIECESKRVFVWSVMVLWALLYTSIIKEKYVASPRQ